MELMGEEKYSFSYSQSRQYVEVGGQLHNPAALPIGVELPVPTEQETR
jgi:hypothetical protein